MLSNKCSVSPFPLFRNDEAACRVPATLLLGEKSDTYITTFYKLMKAYVDATWSLCFEKLIRTYVKRNKNIWNPKGYLAMFSLVAHWPLQVHKFNPGRTPVAYLKVLLRCLWVCLYVWWVFINFAWVCVPRLYLFVRSKCSVLSLFYFWLAL